MIINSIPAGIPAYRLLHEVLRLPENDPDLIRVKRIAFDSPWVRQLQSTQLPDGSWGRFHSQDTKAKSAFRTTEEALDRAFALGLDSHDRPLERAQHYILAVLNGDASITDRDEVNPTWPWIIKLILAGRLAHIDPTHPSLASYWAYLSEVAIQAFQSGNYRLEDEVAAYQRFSGVHIPAGFLESQHALWILSSRKLPPELDSAMLNWIWHKPDGIRYIRAPLAVQPRQRIGYWIRSMNLLTRFESWTEVSSKMLNFLWEQRDAEGLWDFGSGISRCVEFPLSASWHRTRDRKLDYTISLLALLRKAFDRS